MKKSRFILISPPSLSFCTNIFNKENIYLRDHFNRPDHNIGHLSIQATIDTTTRADHMTYTGSKIYTLDKCKQKAANRIYLCAISLIVG